MDTSAGLLIAGVIGVVLGAMIAYLWRFSEHRDRRVPVPAPAVPPGADAVLSVLSSSAVVIDQADTIVRASAAAVAMGIVQEDRLRPDELMSLVRQVRRDGEVRSAELTLPSRRGAAAHIHARVAPLTSRLVLVLAEDRTREHRLQAIRRDFVANVSHELKTPIGAINLLAEATAEAKDDPEAVMQFSARMQTESKRLTRLVQQIIDLSRLQNDTPSEEVTAVKIEELVSQAGEDSTIEAERKGIEIATSVEPELVVRGDAAQLRAAVSNLVENAVTYSPDGSRVAVTAERDGENVRLTVADNGIGIPDDELDRIFERFYRVDPARARSTGGTGLGLSIVKHVAASNGGTIEAWSEPGVGSSFTLVLPTHTVDLDEENP